MSREDEVQLAKALNSLLMSFISVAPRGMTEATLHTKYKEELAGHHIPHQKFGYKDLKDFVMAHRNYLRYNGRGYIEYVSQAETSNIEAMILDQTRGKKLLRQIHDLPPDRPAAAARGRRTARGGATSRSGRGSSARSAPPRPLYRAASSGGNTPFNNPNWPQTSSNSASGFSRSSSRGGFGSSASQPLFSSYSNQMQQSSFAPAAPAAPVVDNRFGGTWLQPRNSTLPDSMSSTNRVGQPFGNSYQPSTSSQFPSGFGSSYNGPATRPVSTSIRSNPVTTFKVTPVANTAPSYTTAASASTATSSAGPFVRLSPLELQKKVIDLLLEHEEGIATPFDYSAFGQLFTSRFGNFDPEVMMRKSWKTVLQDMFKSFVLVQKTSDTTFRVGIQRSYLAAHGLKFKRPPAAAQPAVQPAVQKSAPLVPKQEAPPQPQPQKQPPALQKLLSPPVAREERSMHQPSRATGFSRELYRPPQRPSGSTYPFSDDSDSPPLFVDIQDVKQESGGHPVFGMPPDSSSTSSDRPDVEDFMEQLHSNLKQNQQTARPPSSAHAPLFRPIVSADREQGQPSPPPPDDSNARHDLAAIENMLLEKMQISSDRKVALDSFCMATGKKKKDMRELLMTERSRFKLDIDSKSRLTYIVERNPPAQPVAIRQPVPQAAQVAAAAPRAPIQPEPERLHAPPPQPMFVTESPPDNSGAEQMGRVQSLSRPPSEPYPGNQMEWQLGSDEKWDIVPLDANICRPWEQLKIAPLPFTQKQLADIPKDGRARYTRVYITYPHSMQEIHVVLKNMMRDSDELHQQLKKFYAGRMEEMRVKWCHLVTDAYVVAMVEEGDFKRAMIDGVEPGDALAQVFLVDTGEVKYVPWTNLFYLVKPFNQLPACAVAVECMLGLNYAHRDVPAEGTLTSQMQDKISALARDTIAFAFVKDIEPNKNLLIVEDITFVKETGDNERQEIFLSKFLEEELGFFKVCRGKSEYGEEDDRDREGDFEDEDDFDFEQELGGHHFIEEHEEEEEYAGLLEYPMSGRQVVVDMEQMVKQKLQAGDNGILDEIPNFMNLLQAQKTRVERKMRLEPKHNDPMMLIQKLADIKRQITVLSRYAPPVH